MHAHELLTGSGALDNVQVCTTLAEEMCALDVGSAVRFVRARLAAAAASPSRYQDAATALTHEALVRQSQDNIGVCVIDLRNRSG